MKRILRPLSANIRNEPRGLRLARLFFYSKTSLALSRNFLKFPIYLRPTRVNFSTASSTTIPHPVEGAALLCGRLSPFLFGVSFSTGQSRSFRSASSTACAEKKKEKKMLIFIIFFGRRRLKKRSEKTEIARPKRKHRKREKGGGKRPRRFAAPST